MRPWPGKDAAVAYDVWDSAPYFKKQGEERYALYKTEPAWKVKVVEKSRRNDVLAGEMSFKRVLATFSSYALLKNYVVEMRCKQLPLYSVFTT